MKVFFFNLLIGVIAISAFYNIYKGRNPPPKTGGKAAQKKDSWFGGGMGGMNQIQKANINVFGEDKKIDVRFSDVAGHENAK